MPRKPRAEDLRVVEASGNHFAVGESLGRQCRDQAKRMERRFRSWVAATPGVSMAEAVACAKKVLPQVKDYFPEFIDEVEGYSKGTGIRFEVLLAMLYDFPWDRGRGCTDIAVNTEWTKDDCVYAAHNEDVEPYNITDIAIAKVRPKDEPGFIAVAYGGLLPTVGMNAAGISLTGNAVVPNDTRAGIPKMIPPRKVLRERNLHDALKASMPEARGHSFNNIICDANGEIYSMEGSATTFDAIYASEGYLVHTNHYLSPRMWRFEENMHTRFSSIVRYNRATRLFKKELGKVDLVTFKTIFSDHVGYPESICRHPDPSVSEEEQTMSICSAVFDLTNRVAWICRGNPCVGKYEKHSM